MRSLSPRPAWQHDCADPAATQELARRLAALLRPGQLIGLRGGLGAGKTTFVQGLAMGLGDPTALQVVSPTYAWVHEYHLPRGTLVHLDVYRLDDLQQAEELGLLEEIDRQDAIKAVEWAERLDGRLPEDIIWVTLESLPSGGRSCHVDGLAQPPGEAA